MKSTALMILFCLLAANAFAADANLSGTWVLNPAKSTNIGMMASMQLTETIKQTETSLAMTDVGLMNGQSQTNEIRYDLKGKPSSNQNAMRDKNETISKWIGSKLVTTWTAEGAIAGTKTVRTETRSLSPDGKTMTVETVRGSESALTMVFDKK
jgi:hypothetical protein